MSKRKRNEDLILAQWQTYVEMANSVSQRRDAMNNVFITLNLALLTAVSLAWDIKSVFIIIAGIITCIIWGFFIRHFRLLKTSKFKVIAQLETKLPEAPFIDEWEDLKSSKKYVDGTDLEQLQPITFSVMYIVAIIIISRGG